jgi:hypothetical protein
MQLSSIGFLMYDVFSFLCRFLPLEVVHREIVQRRKRNEE